MERTYRWTMDSVVDALFQFYADRDYWPAGRYQWRSINGLPSPWTITRLVNPQWFPYWRRPDRRGVPEESLTPRPWERGIWRRPWDALQLSLAEDERCTGKMAFKLPNALAKSVAFKRIGFDKLVKEAGKQAQVVHRDERFGTLYALPGERRFEPMYIVRVTNSTAEPDGTFAEYFLRVPPRFWRVQDALAWTFGLDRRNGPRYEPLIET